MKNKYLVALLALIIVFGGTSAVSATTTSARANVEARKAEMEAKRAEIDAKKAEMKANRVEFQQDVAKRKVENTTRVIYATIERLEKIIARIESRMAKLKSNGGNVAGSESYVALAKDNLLKATAAVTVFAGLDLSSEQAQDNFERIRTAAAEAREFIRSAHENLMHAVRLLGQVQSSTRTATSTDSN